MILYRRGETDGTQKLALEREREQEPTQEPQELYDADGKLPLLLF